MPKIAVLFADGFEEVEAITPVDFLRRAGIDVIATGVNGREIIGSHDIRITTDVTIEEITDSELDGIVLPGGMPGAKNIAGSEEAVELINKIASRGKLIAAICAAPGVVLGGKTNILDGKRFTCSPGYETHVKNGKFSEDRVVKDGNVITSRGAGTAAEFSFAVIRHFLGEEPAAKISHATIQREAV